MLEDIDRIERGRDAGFIYLRAAYDIWGRVGAYLGIFFLVTLPSMVISRQVQRMALLLDDLLDVSRITREAGSESRDRRAQVAGDAAVETVRPLLDAKQHVLSIELPDDSITLKVDPLRLSQSLSNLLTNAVKYTDPGGQISLKVRLLRAVCPFRSRTRHRIRCAVVRRNVHHVRAGQIVHRPRRGRPRHRSVSGEGLVALHGGSSRP